MGWLFGLASFGSDLKRQFPFNIFVALSSSIMNYRLRVFFASTRNQHHSPPKRKRLGYGLFHTRTCYIMYISSMWNEIYVCTRTNFGSVNLFRWWLNGVSIGVYLLGWPEKGCWKIYMNQCEWRTPRRVDGWESSSLSLTLCESCSEEAWFE